MKAPTFLLVLLVAGAAAAGGWYAGTRRAGQPAPEASSTRKVLFYQSPMHPWIKSDKPGNCTICGMKLVPVYEGDAPMAEPGQELNVRLGAQSINLLQVATAPVVRQPLRRSVHVAGQIDDDDSAHRRLSATVEGRIEKLFVPSVGSEVTAGQPLVAFFSRELLVARGEYLLALKNASGPERETAVAASRQKLRRMGLNDAQIEKLPQQAGDTIEVLAPISGTVVERKVYEGQYVKEGDVLFEIADFSKMWFLADVYERDLAWIKLGQEVEISTPAVPGKVYRAPIAFIDPNLMENTRTTRLRVVIENPYVGDPAKRRRELLHRVYADGFIQVETPETLTVPRSAVLAGGGAPLAYVDKGGGVYEPRTLKLGRTGDDWVEVLDGLKEGEKVVKSGNLLIDAQAQLNRGAAPEPAPAAVDYPALTASQQAAAKEFLEFADKLTGHLAADDLAGFNASTEHAGHMGMALEAAFAKAGGWEALAAPVAKASAIKPAATLPLARQAYHPLSEALAALVGQLRKQDPAFAGLKIYRCPMTADAFPGAPAKSNWVQLVAPIRNPYMGREMLDCGQEVKP